MMYILYVKKDPLCGFDIFSFLGRSVHFYHFKICRNTSLNFKSLLITLQKMIFKTKNLERTASRPLSEEKKEHFNPSV